MTENQFENILNDSSSVSVIFSNLKNYENIINEDRKKEIAKSELYYLNKKLEKLDKDTNRIIKKIDKIEKSIKQLERDYYEWLIEDTYYNLNITKYLEDLNNLYFDFEFLSKMRSELIKFKKEREKILLNILV